MVHVRVPNVKYLDILDVYRFLANNTTVQAGLEELIAKGWGDYLKYGLVGFTVTGYLVWTGDSAGRRSVAEGGTMLSTAQYGLGLLMSGQTLSALAYPAATGTDARYHRLLPVAFATDGGGNCAKTALVPALASYKARFIIRNVHSTVNGVAGTTLTFTDGAPVAVLGFGAGVIVMGALTAYVVDLTCKDLLGYTATANSAIGMAITNGPVSSVVTLQIEYWYEA